MYPFQIFGFFENMGAMLAVGRMGQRRRNHSSKLLEKWSMESTMRVVDMETFAQPAFVITIPSNCCHEEGSESPDHYFLLKERVDEWPSIFTDDVWIPISSKQKTKKRKTK